MKEIKKQIYLRWDEMLFMFVIAVGAFLFGEILLAVLTYVTHEDEVFEIGTLLALVVPLFITMFAGMSSMGMCFNLGISMCDTRRRLIPMTLIVTYLECLAAAGAAWLFHHLEVWIFHVFYADMKNEIDFGFLFQWKYILVACMVIVAIQALFGTLFLKFGRAAFWIAWALWMFVCIGGPRIAEWKLPEQYKNSAVVQAAREVLGIFHGITENSILIGLTVVAVILLVISYFMLRKQQVTY